MSTFSLRRFAHPEVLRSISPEHLLALLSRHAGVFTECGVALPSDPKAGLIDYEGLAEVFISPEKLPKELADALFFINEMATHEGMELLLEEVEKRDDVHISRRPDQTPADVALQVWLRDRDLLERKHAEQFLRKLRTFEYFQTAASAVPEFRAPSAAVLKALENDLNNWFEKKKRGRTSRVFMYPKEDAVWFLVRRGDPYKREGAIGKNGKSTSVYYWPEKFDVLAYDPVLGEIRVHAGTKGQKKLYRQMFGRHLFGDDSFFPGEQKYTLEPLREKGELSVVCSDVKGMESMALIEVHFLWGGSYSEKEIRRADDVFGAYRAREATMPTRPRIVKASFRVEFSDSQTPRTVTIKPPNVAQYTRDGDSVIVEEWLALRGFILSKEQEYERAAEPVLASA